MLKLELERVDMPTDAPVEGREIDPRVIVRRDGVVTSEEIPESRPLSGYWVRYRWSRSSLSGAVRCIVHRTREATLQCSACIDAGLPFARSYYCSRSCYLEDWPQHRILHDCASGSRYMTNFEKGGFNGSADSRTSEWIEVGQFRTYTPTANDINHRLKFECVVIKAVTGTSVGQAITMLASLVRPAPSPRARLMVDVSEFWRSDWNGRAASNGTFSVLSYNILSNARATSGLYSYCPTWVLSWTHRRRKLLQEIVGYQADILCLQEVQSDHFENFFAPELQKLGYNALYEKRTTKAYVGDTNSHDGCAIFYRQNKFTPTLKHRIEHNAHNLTALAACDKEHDATNQFLKDDISMIAVFSENHGRGPALCVMNTHMKVHQNLKDVILSQVLKILRDLDGISAGGIMPIVACGGFSSVPKSALHSLVVTGSVHQSHPDLAENPLGLMPKPDELSHRLKLESAYSVFARDMATGHGLKHQRERMDLKTKEPLFTKCTTSFVGTTDYIFYSKNALQVESLLELLSEEELHRHGLLPSHEWSSDHVALAASFRYNMQNSTARLQAPSSSALVRR